MGKTVYVEEVATDRYGRVVGLVTVGNLVLNRNLVEYGYAWVYHQYCKKPFCADWTEIEAEAKASKRGLCKNSNALPPWEYRRSKRGKSANTTTAQPMPPGPGCDCSGNKYNCSDFKKQGQAQECYDKCWRLKGRDVHKLDRDEDGRVCESLD